MADFTVRRCGTEDGAMLRHLRLAMLEQDARSFNVDAEATRTKGVAWWEEWAREASAASSKGVVFALNGEVGVGMVAAHVEDGVVSTGALWVEPLHRGKRVAGALLSGVETWAHDVGATTIELSVAEWNKGALGLYDKHYYIDTGRRLPTRFGHRELVLAKQVGF